MNEKIASIIQKAQQERKRAQFERALKRLEQGIASHPDELELYLEAIDTALEGGELISATNLLKTVQDKFTRDRDRVLQFVREKLHTVHDASLARCVVDHAVKRRDLEGAMSLLENVPDHTIRELLNRARTKAQSLKSATHGGMTVRGEAVSNEIANAILSVRLGNLKEAMAMFVTVVEEKPIEYKGLDTFLAALAAKHPKAGRIRHARGCAHRAGGNEIEAIQYFVEAARIEPACAANCAEQLRAMLEKPRHPGKVRRALAETLLHSGNHSEAAQTLREYLAENPENPREVIMLLRPFIDPAHGLNECTWLALDQALGIEQSSVAVELLRGLHQNGAHGTELYAWLEEKSRVGFPPVDVMQFHATLALEQKQFVRAMEILTAVCAGSPQDVPAVLALIDRHRSASPEIEDLYRKHAPKEEPSETPSASDDGDFQTFESNEFHLESSGRPAPAPSRTAAEKPKPRFNSSPFTSSDRNESKPARKSLMDANELSFDDDGAVERPEGDEPMKTSDPIEITESHVANVAQQLYLAGASAFFHIDDSNADDTTDAGDASVAPPAAADAAAPNGDRPAEASVDPAPEPVVIESFDVRYQKFSRGELPNPAVLTLMEDAVSEGRTDELHELLAFTPETGAEHFARYYYQAEYHLLNSRPLQALEILAKLDTPDLADEQKLRIWYKIAVAQRATQNYSGAASTLERLVQLFPARHDLARLKRRNHEQFIEEQALEATTLEKTSSLD